MVGGEKVKFTFASDTLAKGLLPLKANLTAPGNLGKAEFDGRLSFAGAPAFAGEVKAAGQAEPGPWQAQATLAARLDGFEAENIALRLGEGPLADKMSGKASFGAASGKTRSILNRLIWARPGRRRLKRLFSPRPIRQTRSTPASASRRWTGAASNGRKLALT